MALELNVTRKPFSFLGQQPLDVDDGNSQQWGGFPRLKRTGPWHERLMDYTGNPEARDGFERQLDQLGAAAGIKFDYSVYLNKQPIDSQRLLLWAARYGKQELFMAALSSRHFQQGSEGESASKRGTLLAAAGEAGLDAVAAAAFLDTDELYDEVWESYGEMPRRGISGIPLFCFSVPQVGLYSGPFRDANADASINGSSNKQQFLQLLNALYTHVQKEKAKVAVAAPELLIGRTVQLHGLSAKPELNGLVGVCERFDEATGRYGVRLEGHENLQALKAANLNLAQGDEL